VQRQKRPHGLQTLDRPEGVRAEEDSNGERRALRRGRGGSRRSAMAEQASEEYRELKSSFTEFLDQDVRGAPARCS